jgi:hypothetical protein
MSEEADILASADSSVPTSLVVSRLVEILGARLCAVIADVKQTSAVRDWVDGVEPTIGRARILRFAFAVAKIIEKRNGRTTAQSWFLGANHTLGDESPALVLSRASSAREVEALLAEFCVLQALGEFLDM